MRVEKAVDSRKQRTPRRQREGKRDLQFCKLDDDRRRDVCVGMYGQKRATSSPRGYKASSPLRSVRLSKHLPRPLAPFEPLLVLLVTRNEVLQLDVLLRRSLTLAFCLRRELGGLRRPGFEEGLDEGGSFGDGGR